MNMERLIVTTNLFDLKGKIALVTGASRGIGEEIAKLLAEQGAHVIVSSRKLEDCESVAREIREAGGSAEAQPCHVGRIEDIRRDLRAYSCTAWSSGHPRQQRGGQSVFWPHSRHRSGVVRKDGGSQPARLLLHVRGGGQADAGERRRCDRQHGFGQRIAAGRQAGHLLDHQSRRCQHDAGIREGVRAAGDSSECAAPRIDQNPLCGGAVRRSGHVREAGCRAFRCGVTRNLARWRAPCFTWCPTLRAIRTESASSSTVD